MVQMQALAFKILGYLFYLVISILKNGVQLQICQLDQINKDTNTFDFKQTLRNNEIYHMLNKALK